jgi:hypothetical protein
MNLSVINGLGWAWQFQSVHETEAIDVVRRDLLQSQKIRDLHILASWFDNGPSTSTISQERECRADYGEATGPGGQEVENIGECYMIVMGNDLLMVKHRFETLLAMTVALSELSPKVQRIEVKDLGAFRSARSQQIQQYRNLTLHFDPIWSPDGKHLLYTVWEPGRSYFAFLDLPSIGMIKLESLDAYMATRPIWSSDSRFTAYASLFAVKVFDAQTQTTRTLKPNMARVNSSVFLKFEGTRLRFGFDSPIDGKSAEYLYDPNRQELKLAAPPASLPWQESAPDMKRHASVEPVRSPTGRYAATFVFVDRQRRIEVKALQ